MLNQAKQPEISIVIPTYYRADYLVRLLAALSCQTAEKDTFEIIVVDNAPKIGDSKVRALCDDPAYAGLDLKYVHHPVVGVSEARNRGVSAAQAELIGFLDDDTLPHPDWVELVLRIFSEKEADILGGPTEPFYLVEKPSWYRDEYAVTTQGDRAFWLTGTKAVSGANMAWRKQVLEELGGFLSQFGYQGTKKIYGEETELNLRAHQAGYRTWYDPRLKIKHCTHSERIRVTWFFLLGYRYGLSKAQLFFKVWSAQDSRAISMQILSQFKNLFINSCMMIGSILLLPIRSRDKYPFWQNYAVEFIRLKIEKISMSAKMLELYFSGGAKNMRKGQNPAKMGLPAYHPKRLGIALLSCIPSQNGYFTQALEILKYQVASIHQNTTDFDLLVFDNGSCPEVQDELRKMEKLGLIHFLILSHFNLGKTGALNWILSALPNELIGFSDGDVLFRPGWLENTIEILNAFPAAGLVSVQPCLFDILEGKGQARHKLENDPAFHLSDELLNPVVVDEYGRGVGLEAGKIKILKQTPIQIVEEIKTGVRAVVGQSHMQFVLPREVARQILPLPTALALGRLESKRINVRIDQLGLVQLTSIEPFVYHMGNQLDKHILNEIQRMNLDAILQNNLVVKSNSPHLAVSSLKKRTIQVLNWMVKVTVFKKILLRLYNLLFEFFAQEK